MAFFYLPRTCRIETRPNSPSKIVRNVGGAHDLQALPQKQARLPLFFFLILIITILPFNGNSMTSAEKEAVSHTVKAWKTRRNVELDGPKAFGKSVGRIFPVA